MGAQLGRAAIHMTTGIAALLLVQVAQVKNEVLTGVIGWACGAVVALDIIRCGIMILLPPSNRRVITVWLLSKTPFRIGEMMEPTAMTSYCAGILVCYLALPLHLALYAVLILAFGDPFARICGTLIPSRRFANGKSLAGVIGFVGAGLFILLISNGLEIGYPLAPRGMRVGVQFVGVFVGAATEFLFTRFDNFLIPVLSGATMGIIYYTLA